MVERRAGRDPGVAGADAAAQGERPRGAAGSAERHEGLSASFHEKAIKLRTMELRLLLPSAVAIAIVVAGALLVALRGLPWPDLGAGRNFETGTLQTLPLPVAVFGGISLDVAWSLVLAGALHAHLLLRAGGVVAYLVNGATVLFAALGSAPALLMLPFVLASVVVVAIGLYITDRGNHRQAPALHHRTRLRLSTFAWVFGVTTLLYALGAAGGLRQGNVAYLLTVQLVLLESILIPVLFLAGTDFAEWSEVVSGQVGSLLHRLLEGKLRAALAGIAFAVLLWAALLEGGAHRPDPAAVAAEAAPVLVLLLPVGLLGWLAQRRPLSTRVPFWALVLGVATVFAVAVPASLIEANSTALPGLAVDGTPLVVYQHQEDPVYSLSVPQGWARASVPGGVAWTGPAGGRGASRLVLLSTPGAAGAGAAAIERTGAIALGGPLQAGSRTRAGTWDRWDLEAARAGAPQHGVAFVRHDGSREWMLIGLSPAGSDQDALWDAVRDTWTAGPPAEAEVPLPKLSVALPWIALSIVVLFGLGLTLLVRGRGEVASAGLFLLFCALFEAAGANLAGNVFILLGVADWPYVRPQFLAVGVAAGTLLLLAVARAVPGWRLPGPALRLVLVLLLGIIGLVILYQGVFQTALERGQEFTGLQGVVLLAAMLWDVLMSGEAFTNGGGPRVPRHSRVLMYLGYTIAVVTAVVVLGSLGFEGGGAVGGFESDKWVQEGITGFGAPLLFTFFFVNLSAWRRSLPKEEGEIDQVDRSILVETGS